MLARLFDIFNKAPEAYVPVPASQHDEVMVVATDDYEVVSWLEIEQSFTGLLLGVNSLLDGAMSGVEKSSLASIYERYLSDAIPENLVPRLPAVIPKVMRALNDKQTDAAALAEIFSGDVVLVREVIRLANSPYYARSHTYDSLEQAIVNIGFNGVRQMIISVAMKPILSQNSGHFVNIASRYLWDKSMHSALLCDCVAKTLHEDRFHAYLAGLTLQTGMTVLIRELDADFDDMQAPLNMQFIDDINRYASEVSARISQQWQFPVPVTNALREQACSEEPMTMSNLGRIIFLSDKLAKVRILQANGYLEAFEDEMLLPPQDGMHQAYMHCLKKLGMV